MKQKFINLASFHIYNLADGINPEIDETDDTIRVLSLLIPSELKAAFQLGDGEIIRCFITDNAPNPARLVATITAIEFLAANPPQNHDRINITISKDGNDTNSIHGQWARLPDQPINWNDRIAANPDYIITITLAPSAKDIENAHNGVFDEITLDGRKISRALAGEQDPNTDPELNSLDSTHNGDIFARYSNNPLAISLYIYDNARQAGQKWAAVFEENTIITRKDIGKLIGSASLKSDPEAQSQPLFDGEIGPIVVPFESGTADTYEIRLASFNQAALAQAVGETQISVGDEFDNAKSLLYGLLSQSNAGGLFIAAQNIKIEGGGGFFIARIKINFAAKRPLSDWQDYLKSKQASPTTGSIFVETAYADKTLAANKLQIATTAHTDSLIIADKTINRVYSEARAPTENDDETANVRVGDIWRFEAALYTCTNAAEGAAVWARQSGSVELWSGRKQVAESGIEINSPYKWSDFSLIAIRTTIYESLMTPDAFNDLTCQFGNLMGSFQNIVSITVCQNGDNAFDIAINPPEVQPDAPYLEKIIGIY